MGDVHMIMTDSTKYTESVVMVSVHDSLTDISYGFMILNLVNRKVERADTFVFPISMKTTNGGMRYAEDI